LSVVRFNTKIYKREAIKKTLSAYSSLADFILRERRDYIDVEIWNPVSQSGNILADEFSNYALGMVKKCR